jgi:hypothetical protein
MNDHPNTCARPGYCLIRLRGLALRMPALCGWIFAVLALGVTTGQAGNILVNNMFSANSGVAVPTGWTYFDAPTVPASTQHYAIGGPPAAGFLAAPLSGTQYWKEFGAGYFLPPTNNVAGIYQEFQCAPGSVYQASGWFYTSSDNALGDPTFNSRVWIDVSFLDASSNLLALYTSADFSAAVGEDAWFQFQVTNACNLSAPVATGDPYFTNYAVTGAVTNMVAPSGTSTVRYRFAYLQYGSEGGTCYFDDPTLDQSAGVSLTVVLQGSSVIVSFPSQSGVTYGVYSRTNLSVGTWNLLTNVPGDGAMDAVSVPATNSAEFYMVTAP